MMPYTPLHDFSARNRAINTVIAVGLIFGILYMAFNPGIVANAQTATPTTIPIMDYVEIQDGEYMAIERTVTIGELGLSIILLGILTTLFMILVYKIVVDKLP